MSVMMSISPRFTAVAVVGMATTIFMARTARAEFDHDHPSLNRLLTEHVRNGNVNYRALKKDRTVLKSYLKQLSAVTKGDMKGWTRDEKLAYWINAYNAYTIHIILTHYPIKRRGLKGMLYPKNSIRQIAGVWDKIQIRAGGRTLTLNTIEHKILRQKFREPRIHFALVCASRGCPALQRWAYRAGQLSTQLDKVAKAFVNDSSKVKLDTANGTLYLSKIFDWFNEDFNSAKGASGYGKHDGAVSFCLRYFPKRDQTFLRRRKVRIKWLDYDWHLNEQGGRS